MPRNEYYFSDDDLISILPDGILLTILEKLPVEEARNTALLGRRWKSLWKSMSFIEVDNRIEKDGGKNTSNFMKHFMRLYQGDKLICFSISLRYEGRRRVAYKSWMTFALSKNVEELSLELYIYEYNWRTKPHPIVPFPDDLFNCSSLARLKLTFANLDPLPPFHLESLRDLHLSKSQLPDDGVEIITAHCPLLQNLVLSNCNRDRDLKINVSPDSNLSRIIIDDKDHRITQLPETSINAPKLTALEILASTWMRKYSIVNVADAVEARLSLEEVHPLFTLEQAVENQIRMNIAMLLEKLQDVKLLGLCTRCILVVREMRGRDLKFTLTRLVLDTQLGNEEILGIIRLLRACPGLEQLVINITVAPHKYPGGYGYRDPLPLELWQSQAYSVKGCLQGLAVLEFKNLTGPYQTWDEGNFEMEKLFVGCENGIQLVKLLLSSDANLERIAFSTAWQQCEVIGCTDES